MPSRFYNGLVRSSGTVVVFNLGQTSAGLDIKVYPVQATAAGSIELSLGAGAHKAKFLSAANAGDEFALLASSVSVCEMVRLRERTAFSNIPLPGDSKHSVTVERGKAARLYIEFHEMQDGGDVL